MKKKMTLNTLPSSLDNIVSKTCEKQILCAKNLFLATLIASTILLSGCANLFGRRIEVATTVTITMSAERSIEEAPTTIAKTSDSEADGSESDNAEPDDTDTSATSEKEDGDYLVAEISESNMKFKYPENWIALSTEILEDPDNQESIEGTLSMSKEALQAQASAVTFTLFDPDQKSDNFISNISLFANQEVGSISLYEASLSLLAPQFEEQFAPYYTDIQWVLDPALKVYENTKTMEFRLSGEQNKKSYNVFRAYVFNGDISHIFTYTIDSEHAEAAIPVWEHILSSVEFQ